MAKALLGALSALVLVGCATPDDLRLKPPEAVYESERSARDVADCIMSWWENDRTFGLPTFGLASLRMRPTSSGYSVSIGNHIGGTFHIADISEKPSGGSTTAYRSVYDKGQSFEYIDHPVEACQRRLHP